MRKLTTLFMMAFFAISTSLSAQTTNAHTKLKTHINDMVQKVHKADSPEDKRTILNSDLDNLITAVDRVESMGSVSEEDKKGLSEFKASLQEKHDELNGKGDFNRVQNNQLNNFANFIQQDFEQADRVVTLSLTTALLIVLILLLL